MIARFRNLALLQYATQLVEVREKGNEEQKNKRKLDQEFKKIKEEKVR